MAIIAPELTRLRPMNLYKATASVPLPTLQALNLKHDYKPLTLNNALAPEPLTRIEPTPNKARAPGAITRQQLQDT